MFKKSLFTTLILATFFLFNVAPNALAETQEGTLTVVSYNIRHGSGMDGKLNLERTAETLKKLDADVIALQEVDNQCKRSGSIDQAAKLGEMLGMKSHFVKFMDFQGGQYGLAILSRLPVSEKKTHVLPAGAEPRSAAEIILSVPLGGGKERKVSFVSLHLDWTSSKKRLPQIKKLLDALKDREMPLVLIGDFNAKRGDPTLTTVQKAGYQILPHKNNAKTFPAKNPTQQIDFIAIKGLPNNGSQEIEVIDEEVASDHRPLRVQLRCAP